MRDLADLLTEQSSFCQAVQARDIHRAASIAAKLASRCNSPQHLKTPDAPYSADPQDVYGLQEDMLAVEEMIPWACVRKIWKSKRGSWRREVKQTSSIRGFAKLLKDVRQALLITGDVQFTSSAEFTLKTAWKAQLEKCVDGTARASTLDGVWLEFKTNVNGWLTSMTAEAQQERLNLNQADKGQGVATEQFGTARDTVAPGLIVRAMERARGSLLCVPVESMLGECPAVRLAAVREVLGKKRDGKGEGGGEGEGEGGQDGMREGDEGVGVVMAEDSFDSGASTGADADEVLTDVDDVFDMLV